MKPPEIASHMLGVNLVTAQDRPRWPHRQARPHRKKASTSKRELYLSISRSIAVSAKVVFMASASGGMTSKK